MHGYGLDAAIQRTGEVQNQHTDELIAKSRDMGFARRVHQAFKNPLVRESESEPRFGHRHEISAKACFRRTCQGPDDNIVHSFAKMKIVAHGNNFEL